MDPGHRGWAQPGNAHGPGAEQNQSQRPGASFGSQHQTQQSPPVGHAGLPPPSGHFAYQQPTHGLGGMNQSSPRQPPPSTHRPEGPQGPNFPLPTLSQATGQASVADRERAREAEQIHIKEEQDRQHREQERQRLEQAPQHQAQGQPMQLHQPVAVGPRTVHGPNGLLGNPGLAGPQQQGQFPLGGPGAPNNMFGGGPVQSTQAQGQQNPSALLMPFAPAQAQAQQQQQMGQGQGQGQGQQPILNDALSYLDQVKVQFADHPDVYNRFLDIMKDFKSGAIDTPGVIGRVSQLFAGNPELIQGFNTFLPPGYRIECGAGDDPNAIRVTTPMGTTVQSMPQPRPLSRQEGGESMRRSNGTYTPQPGQGNQMIMSPSGRAIGQTIPGPHISPMEAARQQEQQAIHQQQERGVNQLQNAVSAATGGANMRAALSPAPGRGTPGQEAAGDAHGMEKRGPVEFNHAISYVNKIKNRFATQPDIYKQFLEILQTYQRESKPIQDVYGQVTHLFKTAPDLLGDFKQFLPESAAAAKAQAQARQQAEEQAIMSNVRGEPIYASPVMSKEVGMGTPSHRTGLPPVGNFAPTPVVKDNKRKRNERQGTAGSAADGAPAPANGKGQYPGPGGKRMKQTHNMAQKTEQPPASPTLIPALPSPIPPTTSSAATSEELGFFDRAKKAISNKNTFNEFLKLCNLFSQDLVDRTVLIHRARAFIGTHPELMKWFQEFIGYDEKDVIVENKARIPGGRVSLSNCRGLGPSYRLLPKRERQKTCSGRDELCNSVLNDEWASHPTWASEDSGFIAHKKNLHEEGLHRIEEERHDYDYNIEACARTIQLLEPLATQLRNMSEQEQPSYKLPPGLGGQSETIYKRVIMKVYGRDKGQDVIQQLHLRPFQVVPVLLNRLKERLETWKLAQREWEKVWREQTQRMFWKSLDHQFVNTRASDKRAVQMKVLQAEIQMKHEEMKREDKQIPGVMHKPQLEYTLEDTDVILDLSHLLLVYIDQTMSTDTPRLLPFVKEFIPLFFGLDSDWFNTQINARLSATDTTSVNDATDDYASGADDSTPSRGRKPKSNNLLRSALDRGRGRPGRKDREDSNASASRASTPDVASNADDEMAVDTAEESDAKQETSTARWLDHPASGNTFGDKSVNPGEQYARQTFRMWSNTPMYGFVRMFVMLYERLLKLKMGENECRETIKKAITPKPAADLGILDKMPQEFFDDISPNANYYRQMLDKFIRVFTGDVDFADVEETLRRFYLQSGYQLYSLDKIVQQLSRFATSVLNSEGKDKSYDIYQAFRRDRIKEFTTAQQQTDYRKTVEKMLKDGELYRVDYDQEQHQVRIYLTKKDDPTFDDALSAADKEHIWRYYLASYTTMTPTEGVSPSLLTRPVLTRSVRATGANPDSVAYPPSPADGDESTNERLQRRFDNIRGKENLVMRIAVNNYQRIFQPGTEEGWIESANEREGAKDDVSEVAETHERRIDASKEKWEYDNDGMKDVSQETIEKANIEYQKLINEGAQETEGESMDVE